MNKAFILSIIFLALNQFGLRADEGMWMLPYIKDLNETQMQQMGLELDAEKIYSINNSSLKDGVVIFGGGCTGEIISDKGLILTNHHCGYGTIQSHSSVENNYLANGFWAANQEEEIPSPGLSVKFLKSIEDVSERVLAAVNDSMDQKEWNKLTDSVITIIKDEVKDTLGILPSVKAFYSGNKFYLLKYQEYRDVRFVGAPPSSIGKFGADTDNWMWPRHTGDFSLFRVYSDSLGNPANYSKDNIPYKPKFHFSISLKGNAQQDFAMILGFPGSTDRYLTSWGIEERINIVNMARIQVRKAKQDVWLEDMQADEKIRIQYASKYARSSNYYKNSIGMNRGIRNLNVLDKKRKIESDFEKWVKENEDREGKYGSTLSLLENGYQHRASSLKAKNYLKESLISGAEIFMFAANGRALLRTLKLDDEERTEIAVKKFKNKAEDFYKNYNPSTDEKTVAEMLRVFAEEIDATYHPSVYRFINKKYKGDYIKYSKKLFDKSIFANEERLNAFLKDPKASKLEKDPAFKAAISIFSQYKTISELANMEADNIAKGKRLFEAGLQEMYQDKVFYPDANFTMRMSYGKVDDYMARDAVHYLHYTTLEGVMEKEDPDNWEFVVPAKLKDLFISKDYGRYAAKDGKLHVNFLSDNDITGGNSGSPVINAKGELFGLAFDGNWEAMSGDIAFEPALQRTINVDIRYVLFIIDKFAGASHLVDEMTIVE